MSASAPYTVSVDNSSNPTQGATLESRDFQCYVEGTPAFKKENPDKAILMALTQYLEGIRTDNRAAYLEIATAVASRHTHKKKPIFVDNIEDVADAFFVSLFIWESCRSDKELH